MTKQEITHHLKSNHEEFIQSIASLNETEFNFAREGKWNAGQTLDHLNRAVRSVSKGMLLPKFLFALLFGKANRASKSYDELVAKYKMKLEEGGKAHGIYLPTKVSFSNQKKTETSLEKLVNSLCKSINAYTEEQLDQYILPHPLLGKLTIREMMYFTIYHAEHHTTIVRETVAK